ncbi:MAG: hypothetical protein IJI47_00135 [Eubacterium sp.]|nr:hypothetical protein [Eubacterium sp.]
MKNKTRLILAVSAIAVLCAAAFTVFADQENNFDSPCEHSYAVREFSGNTAHFVCEHCGDEQSIPFADYVGARSTDSDFEPLLDLNNDGIINGRDLANLKNS